MYIFTGKYSATLDGKGRLVLPSAIKKELGDDAEKSFVVEMDRTDKCLNIFPEESWNEKIIQLRMKHNNTDKPQIEKALSRFFAEVFTLNMAENGRMNIPDEMLVFAGIKREAIFVGQGKIIRLWDPDRYKASQIDDDTYEAYYKELLGGLANNF